MKAYNQNKNQIKLMGPTNFVQIIQEAKKIALQTKNPKMYHIVLILTDGQIHDYEDTV